MVAAPDTSSTDPTGGAGTGGLAAVLHDNRAAVLRFLGARAGNPDLAQDLYQELWLRLAQARPGPIDDARSYVFRAASNLVLDQRRAELRRSVRDGAWAGTDNPMGLAPDKLPDPAPDAEETVALGQELAILRRAIDALPAGARRALQLHRIEGLAQADVATTMGISRSGVEKHMAVAMKHLRRAFADWGKSSRAASGQEDACDRPDPERPRQQRPERSGFEYE